MASPPVWAARARTSGRGAHGRGRAAASAARVTREVPQATTPKSGRYRNASPTASPAPAAARAPSSGPAARAASTATTEQSSAGVGAMRACPG
jgi:hypothetical protein